MTPSEPLRLRFRPKPFFQVCEKYFAIYGSQRKIAANFHAARLRRTVLLLHHDPRTYRKEVARQLLRFILNLVLTSQCIVVTLNLIQTHFLINFKLQLSYQQPGFSRAPTHEWILWF